MINHDIKNNIISMWRDLSESRLVITKQIENFFAIECCYMENPLFNYAIETTVDKIISDSVERYYSLRKKPYFYWVDRQRAFSYNYFNENGFVRFADLSAMHMSTEVLPESKIASVPMDIRRVHSLSELADWSSLMRQGFDLSEKDAGALSSIIGYSLQKADNFYHYIAYYKGISAAVLTLYVQGDKAGVYNGTTFHTFRRQGLMTALLSVALKQAHNCGCKMLVAQAGRQSRKLLSEFGFSAACKYDLYIKPAYLDFQMRWSKAV